MSCPKIAGYHDLYWQPVDWDNSDWLGMTGPEGIELTKEINMTPIVGDALGPDTIIDGIYQGGNVSLSFTLQDVKLPIVKKFLNPFLDGTDLDEAAGSIITGRPERIGYPGRMVCDFAGKLYAIPRAGTPAASLNPGGASGRMFQGIASGPRVESLDTRPRFIPIMFQAYPFYDTTISPQQWVWWRWTDANND